MDVKSASTNERSFRSWMTHFYPLTHSLLYFSILQKIFFLFLWNLLLWGFRVWTETTKKGYRRITTVQMWVYQDKPGHQRTSPDFFELFDTCSIFILLPSYVFQTLAFVCEMGRDEPFRTHVRTYVISVATWPEHVCFGIRNGVKWYFY